MDSEVDDKKADKGENGTNSVEELTSNNDDMLYGVQDVPWPPMMFVFGLQVKYCVGPQLVLP